MAAQPADWRCEQLPLDERAAWLYQKAGMFLLDGPWRGALVCARAVPAGDTTQIFGGIESVALLDSGPDPIDLVFFLTRCFAPPAPQNTEGDPLARGAAGANTPGGVITRRWVT